MYATSHYIDKILHAVNPTKLENKGKTKEQNGTTIRFRPDNEYSRMDLILIQVSLSKYLKQSLSCFWFKNNFYDASDQLTPSKYNFIIQMELQISLKKMPAKKT
ncbi:MAG: hypothetical protein CM15mP111_4790 [Hyphomicrobiales bacterium]|nr:MAG: hypothetical protein CM15mP111_4790 [Hyphomicrobiales bacterium]